MKTSKLLIALSIFCLMLGACASTNDDEPSLSDSQTNGDQIPSAAARQDDIAYTDISRNPEVPKIVDVTTTVDASTAEQTGITNDAMTSSSTVDSTTVESTTVDSTLTPQSTTTTTTTQSTTSSNLNNTPSTTSTTNTDSMTSSSTTDDTDTTDDTETASRTRMRKD